VSATHRSNCAGRGCGMQLAGEFRDRGGTPPARPGPQPCNRAAPTAEEQLARARRGRLDPARRRRRQLRALVRELARRVLADELPAALTYLLAHRGSRNGTPAQDRGR
jgi:hypothetical protein